MKFRGVSLPALFFSQIVWATQGPLRFHLNVRMGFSIYANIHLYQRLILVFQHTRYLKKSSPALLSSRDPLYGAPCPPQIWTADFSGLPHSCRPGLPFSTLLSWSHCFPDPMSLKELLKCKSGHIIPLLEFLQ